MTLPDCETLLLTLQGGVLDVVLNRPEKRNAMNDTMVRELRDVFAAIHDDRSVRAVVLRGAEGNFCSGGDISGMNARSAPEAGAKPVMWEFNRSFGRMITEVNAAPQVVIACLEGAVLGGGFGLACISDVAIADTQARFGMPETGLGIIPAQIAPFVVKRIGLTQARKLALLGDWVAGDRAEALGLVHMVTSGQDAMDAALAKVLESVQRAAPGANALTKKLLLAVDQLEHEALLDQAADWFAEALGSEEGREGTRAFMEKRKPNWAQEN